MKKVFLFTALFFITLISHSQNFNFDELVKIQKMNHSEIDSYLNSSSSNWSNGPYYDGTYIWNFEPGNKKNNIILQLNLSLDDETQNRVGIITTNSKICQSFKNQILKYKMKKIGSKTENKILIEEYSSANYILRVLKMFNNIGDIIYGFNLRKK